MDHDYVTYCQDDIQQLRSFGEEQLRLSNKYLNPRNTERR